MMGFWQPVTNLRDYISQNPPVVTFFLGLTTLAISFICLSSYIYTHTLPNPDTVKDWNNVLSSLSQFHLCVKDNGSSSGLLPPVLSPLKNGVTSIEPIRSSSFTTLRLKVHLLVTTTSYSDSVKNSGLHTTLRAKQLSLGDNEIINMTLEVLSGNDTDTCLIISGPTHLLPMSVLPPKCPTSEKSISSIYVVASNQPPTSSQTCYNLHSKPDPKLIVMLKQEEQHMAAQHLLEVSLCLLGVCLGLCLAASLTRLLTRRHNLNGLDIQNELLLDT